MLLFDDVRINVGDGRPELIVDFMMRERERVLLIGPNGSGKTSILDAVIGLRRVSGRVEVGTTQPIAYSVQDSLGGLLPWLSAEDNILLPSHISAELAVHRAQAMEMMTALSVHSLRNALPFRLSGGERQIINLIRAACMPSEVVLLDEPFASLHSRTRRLVIEKILPAFDHKTVLIISHDPDDLELNFHRVFFLDGSRLREATIEEARSFLKFAA